jgi:serine/threonine protein kinase
VECKACGHLNRDGARFCEECGGALQAVARETGSVLPSTVGAGRYRVQRLLGEGSRKVVYAASDSRLGRDVAVAIIKTEGLDDAGRRWIDREARAMARLGDHPNIVTVFDVGDDDAEPYIVSELMPGGSVADAIADADDHRLDIADALRIGEQVALALEHSHSHGVVHRDLKPANVWLAADGNSGGTSRVVFPPFGGAPLRSDTDQRRVFRSHRVQDRVHIFHTFEWRYTNDRVRRARPALVMKDQPSHRRKTPQKRDQERIRPTEIEMRHETRADGHPSSPPTSADPPNPPRSASHATRHRRAISAASSGDQRNTTARDLVYSRIRPRVDGSGY